MVLKVRTVAFHWYTGTSVLEKFALEQHEDFLPGIHEQILFVGQGFSRKSLQKKFTFHVFENITNTAKFIKSYWV